MRHHTNAETVTQKYFFEKLVRKRNFSTWDLLCVLCSTIFYYIFFIGQMLAATSEADHKN